MNLIVERPHGRAARRRLEALQGRHTKIQKVIRSLTVPEEKEKGT